MLAVVLGSLIAVMQPVSCCDNIMTITKLVLTVRLFLLKNCGLSVAQGQRRIPVMGMVHYYHQGPVFIDDSDPVKQEELRWNEAEDITKDKDMGAVKGTNVKDL